MNKSAVLIVDDSGYVHKSIRAYLEPEALSVFSAFDGAAAMRAAAQCRPNVILLDVDMPELDGFEVCRRLKANPQTAAAAIIFLTADATLASTVKALDLGAVDYITKPFKPEELRARVRSALQTQGRLQRIEMIDWLTGLWNESYLEIHLAAQLALAERSGRPLTCIAADIDRLGEINAQHGDAVGDEIIRAVAHALVSQCRLEDTVCYRGSGKFAALLSGTNRTAAARVVERLQRQIENQPVSFGDARVAVSCSFGVSDSEAPSDLPLLERTTAALQRTKSVDRGISQERAA